MKRENTNLIFSLGIVWVLMILSIGIWWLYLLSTLESQFIAVGPNQPNLNAIIKWEGGTFILLLLFLSATLWSIYLKERAYNRSLTSFLAGVTHELKTPLASIRLQAEAVEAFIQEGDIALISKLIGRLTEDTSNLETQLDKLLHLSRLEQNGTLNLLPIDYKALIADVVKKHSNSIQVKLNLDDSHMLISGDHFALELIIKNLIENSKRHSKDKQAVIATSIENGLCKIIYCDNGVFHGDINQIGQIFYKHNSVKGSGIGLYLVRKLTSAMKGVALFTTENKSLKVILTIPTAKSSV